MFKCISSALLATAVFLLPAQAQMRGSVAGSPAHGTSFSGAFISANEIHAPFYGRSEARHFYPPILLGAPYYYADYGSQPIVTGAPQVVVVEVPAPVAAEATRETRAEPLLIELQGDRYVQVSGSQARPVETPTQPGYSEVASAKPIETAKRAKHAEPPTPELEPAVLVYRDSHREQVREYTIAGDILYASGNYWTDGYWTKKIQLSALNLPATEQACQQRGVKFMLPGSPNEVVTRP